MRHYNIPVFIPHEGCPHACIFCNQKKITGVQTSVTPAMAEEIIKEGLSWLPKGERQAEAAFFGGSFTGLPLSLQRQFYEAARRFGDQISGIRLSTRPDYITEPVLELAASYGVTVIELGAQSAEDAVLEKNERRHTFSETCLAVEQIRQAGIAPGIQMMTGMYGSDAETDLRSARLFAELDPVCARIYPVLVLKDTILEQLYRQGEYRPQTLEEAVETAKGALLEFRSRNIPVIRLGLHAGEDLRQPGTVAAGPFHPAFGELVESRIWRDKLEEMVLKQGKREIKIPAREMSRAVGHKGCNRRYFQEKYGILLRFLPAE